jgi:ribosome biogenesis protein MAK21
MTGLDFSKFAADAQDDSDLDSVASGAEEKPTKAAAAPAPAAADDSESEGEMIIEGKKKTKKEVEEVVRKEKKENEVKKAREGETLAGLVEGATFDGAVGKPKKGDYVRRPSSGRLADIKTHLTSSCAPQIFPPIPQWYMQDLPALPATSKPLPQLTPSLLTTLSARSSLLLSALPTTQPAPSSSAADKSFLSKILRSGTHSDKLSALILLVQADPIRNVGGLEGLRGMMGWKKDESGNGGTVGRMGGREERVGVVRAVVDWFVGGGAPDRKLRYLRDQPQLTHPKATDAHLIVWAFEDFLKRYFFTLLQVLEVRRPVRC